MAFLALEKYLPARSCASAVFALATMLGTLSHLTFVQFYIGAAAWSVIACQKNATSWLQRFAWLAGLHAVPACFLLALYAIDMRTLLSEAAIRTFCATLLPMRVRWRWESSANRTSQRTQLPYWPSVPRHLR